MEEPAKSVNIRLREGEYQYSLVKTIAAFQLGLHFPDVKDIIGKLYEEEKTSDIQFVRKIQTILKKMEKSGIVRILPKKRPWELQRYALLSFKFQDADNNLVSLATDNEVNDARNVLRSTLNHTEITKLDIGRLAIFTLVLVGAYATVVWALVQAVINPIVFVISFSASVALSVKLGQMLTRV